MTPELQQLVDTYFQELGVRRIGPADTVLALLKINTHDALRAAEELVGKPIWHCPPGLPPWPPKPVHVFRTPTVTKVARNGRMPTTDAFQRYRLVKVGLTKQQLKTRGVTQRDLTAWTRAGLIRWSTAK